MFYKKKRAALRKTKTGYRILKGKEEIEALVIELLGETFFNQEKPKINAWISLESHFIYEAIYNFYKDSEKEVEINHLNFIQKEIKKEPENRDYRVDHFELLKYTLLFALLGKKGYHPYYYYGHSNIIKEIGVLTPYFLSTNASVILFSQDFESAIFYDDQIIVSFYQSKIEKIVENLPLLLEQGSSLQEMDEQPLFCAFCMTGLKEMIKTKEIPIFLSEPEREEAVFYFLKGIRDKMKDHALVYYAVNPEKFKMPEKLEIITTEKKETVFRCFNQNQETVATVFIKEEILLGAFQDFVESIVDSKYLYTQKESIAILEECMRELEGLED